MTAVAHQSAALAGAVHTPSPEAPVYTQGPCGVNRSGGRVGLGGGGRCLTARSCELREEGSGLSGEGGAAPCLLRELRAVLRAQCICAWERLVFTESWELEAVPAPEIGPLLVQLMSPGCVGSPHCGGVITSCAPPWCASVRRGGCRGEQAGGCVSKCKGPSGSGGGAVALGIIQPPPPLAPCGSLFWLQPC